MRILIVEDDISFQKVLSSMIRRFLPEIICETCVSVPDTKKFLATFPTDILLLDIMLPGGSGIDVLKAFPNPEFSIICMTAKEFDIHLHKEALAHGAAAVLWKPFDPEELKEALANVIKMRVKILNKPIGNALMPLITPHNSHPSEATNPLTIEGDVLVVPTSKGIVFQIIAKIICVEAHNNYTIIYRIGDKPLVVRCFISHYERFLSELPFFRVNRSFIVNMHYIREVEKESRSVLLKEEAATSKPIIISQAKMKLLREMGKNGSFSWLWW